MRRLLPVVASILASCGSGPSPDLESQDPYERYLGALQAARGAPEESLPKLERLLRDPDPFARIGAVVALVQSRRPEAARLLAPALVDPDLGVRAEAARAAGEVKDPALLPALLAILSTDAHAEPRRTAALALEAFGNQPEVRGALLTALADPAAGVAFNAHRSLCRITGRADLPRRREAAEEALKGS
jgi:HEAT repeat protein